jgi:hypothetical protein
MGYTRGTKVTCTNPDILASGSTFNIEWADSLLEIKNGVAFYICPKEYLNDALIELSKQHPDVTFSGVTWTDDDFETSIDFTFVLNDGIREFLNEAPHYQILFPVIDDDEYNSLAPKFVEQINKYLQRLDIVRVDTEEIVFDFLNDKEDKDGFKSYYTITWENNEHRFTATKRYTSQIIVGYEKKQPKMEKTV